MKRRIILSWFLMLLLLPAAVMADTYVVCYKSRGTCISCFRPVGQRASKDAKREAVCPEGAGKMEFGSVAAASRWISQNCNCPEHRTPVPPGDFD